MRVMGQLCVRCFEVNVTCELRVSEDCTARIQEIFGSRDCHTFELYISA